jgi:hypothetical protein
MKNTMMKKIILFLGIAGQGIAFLVDYLYKNHLFISGDVFDLVLPTLFVLSLPLLLFSLITYKMREEVFRAWFNFAKWWVPISIFLTLITPGGSGGGFGIPSVFDQEFAAFILAALFFIISIIIIVREWLKLRGK